MPGITGIVSNNGRFNGTPFLGQMSSCMKHEPFYSSGTYANERVGLWLGWTCHKGSFSDCLPVWNEKKDVCLIFSGEEFADEAEIQRLAARGHGFTREDASYLVHMYEEQGITFLERLNGWFSGVLLDLSEEKGVLFNDRYGLNRIYYHENADGLFFASEAKCLVSVLPELRKLDPTGLAEFLSCGCVLQNRTLFSGISLLPGASKWTFSRTQPAKKDVYFRKETWESQPALEPCAYYERLKSTFTRVLPKYFRGAKRIGMSLTGGLDGRMIMAWATRSPGSLPCYTFGSAYRDCTDVTAAREVAKVCRQPYQVIPVDRELRFTEVMSLSNHILWARNSSIPKWRLAGGLRRQLMPTRHRATCSRSLPSNRCPGITFLAQASSNRN